MARRAAQDDAVSEHEAREGLIGRIMQMECDLPRPSREEAEHLADDVWPFHPDNPNSPYTDAEVEEHVKDALRYEQGERTLEQNFLLGGLSRWLLCCTPFIGGAAYALTLPQRDQRIVLSALLAGVVTVITRSFRLPVQTARRAMHHRHMQVRVLTTEFPKFRAWGFSWRTRAGRDLDHRLTLRHCDQSMSLLEFTCWLFPLCAAFFL
jgi:hypothetical protein